MNRALPGLAQQVMGTGHGSSSKQTASGNVSSQGGQTGRET